MTKSFEQRRQEAQENSQKRLLKAGKKPAEEYEQCGTPPGWRKHQRLGEVACRKCRTAWAQYIKSYRQKNGRAKRRKVS